MLKKLTAERFTDLDKLNFVTFAYGIIVLGYSTFSNIIASTVSKNDIRFKSGQNWFKTKSSKFVTYSVKSTPSYVKEYVGRPIHTRRHQNTIKHQKLIN